MARTLVLQNITGDIVRVFPWTRPEKIWTIFRKDTRRIEVHSNLSPLKKKRVSFDILAETNGTELSSQRVAVQDMGYLELVDSQNFQPLLDSPREDNSGKYRKAALFALFFYLLFGMLMTRQWSTPEEIAEVKEEKKREIVKVVRKKLVLPKVAKRTVSLNRPTQKTVKPKVQKKAWKRRGALAALGQLSISKQKGGLNLGALKTTAGVGMGGTGGSGGVQKSIYAKGLVAAPLGEGHNVKGGGGYGTKGKGGGQAGYGSLSLVGSSGTSLIPIPSEATIDGGLSSDLIADVVRRNLGQVRFCYEQGLQLDPRLAGRVSVAWTIDPRGGVKIARVKKTSLNNSSVEQCIIKRLRTWKFPLPENNVEVKVSYPFLLKRVGSS